MDAKCYITTCDLLDIGLGVVNELGYGIDCEQAKYCHFAQFYVEYDLLNLRLINEDEGSYPILDDIDIDKFPPELPYNPDDAMNPYDPDNDFTGTDPVIEGINSVHFTYSDYICELISLTTTTTTTSTTTTTTTTQPEDCFLKFGIVEEYTTTTTTTSTTTTTTTTPVQLPTCNVQVDVLEITW